MIPLFTPQEFDECKSLDSLTCQCKTCSQPFSILKKAITHGLKTSTTVGIYCSRKCQSQGYTTKVKCECLNCKKTFYRIPCEIKNSTNHFCSKSCSASYNNRNKTRGTRRSKVEIFLEQELLKLYPFLDLKFNEKEAIHSELDIYIPHLKLAIEINGIYHYKPIHGQNKLDKIISNDKQKLEQCNRLGIKLLIIDVSKQNKFTEDSSTKFLDLICKNINNLLILI